MLVVTRETRLAFEQLKGDFRRFQVREVGEVGEVGEVVRCKNEHLKHWKHWKPPNLDYLAQAELAVLTEKLMGWKGS